MFQLNQPRARQVSTGIGGDVDAVLFGGGLHEEICEVFGPPGVGKTQVGLTIAAHCAANQRVVYATTQNPLQLALRVHDILVARGHGPHDIEAVLERLHLIAIPDFAALARLLCDEKARPVQGPPSLLVVDTVSAILAPCVSVQGFAQRWRLAWTWRTLRQMARESIARVLLFSHTVAGQAHLNGGAKSVASLGPLWSTAASTRIELSRPSEDPGEGSYVLMTLRKSADGHGASRRVVLGRAGVEADSMES